METKDFLRNDLTNPAESAIMKLTSTTSAQLYHEKAQKGNKRTVFVSESRRMV